MFLVVLATVAVAVPLAVRLQNLLLGLPKGSPRLKMPFGIFFCLQSQIAVWALKRLRAFLLSLRMRMIREHAQKHMVENGGFISSVVLKREHEYYDFFTAQVTYKCIHRLR